MSVIKTHEELLRELYEAIVADAKELGIYREYSTLMEVFENCPTTLKLYHEVIATLKGQVG
jgi:hypothetical protein